MTSSRRGLGNTFSNDNIRYEHNATSGTSHDLKLKYLEIWTAHDVDVSDL